MLGKAYVAVAFPPEGTPRALEMVHNLEAALGDKIATLAWMSERHAQGRPPAKLAAFDEQDRLPGQVARLLRA